MRGFRTMQVRLIGQAHYELTRDSGSLMPKGLIGRLTKSISDHPHKSNELIEAGIHSLVSRASATKQTFSQL